jgi:hypothetical protein
MRNGPLKNAEREFLKLDLDISDLVALLAPFVDDRPTTLLELRGALLGESMAREVRDRVWRRLIADARDHEEWMVAALGLAMPALKASAKDLCKGLDPRAAEEVEEEILAGFVAALRQADTDWHRLAWTLRCRAHRSGLRARKEALAQPVPVADLRSTVLTPTGNPDMVLQAAVHQGVISVEEADVIGRTRLEGVSLTSLARERGEAYWRLAKRRSRAERRLADAIRSRRVSARALTLSVA